MYVKLAFQAPLEMRAKEHNLFSNLGEMVPGEMAPAGNYLLICSTRTNTGNDA